MWIQTVTIAISASSIHEILHPFVQQYLPKILTIMLTRISNYYDSSNNDHTNYNANMGDNNENNDI